MTLPWKTWIWEEFQANSSSVSDAEIVRRKANNLPVIQRVPWVLLWTLRIEDVCFPSITFPCEQKLQPDGSMQFAENENTSTGAMSPSGQPLFCLWGITLGITSDLCMLVKQHERRWINWPPLTFNSKAVIPNGILKGIYGFIEIYRFPRLRISPANVFLAASICVGIGGLMAFSVKPIKRFVASWGCHYFYGKKCFLKKNNLSYSVVGELWRLGMCANLLP